MLGALLWMCITRLDALTDTILLQKEVTRATIAHALMANATLKKIQSTTEKVGLYFPRMKPPLRLVSVHDAWGSSDVRPCCVFLRFSATHDRPLQNPPGL